ncbi:MAG: lipid IV(A) palmitoyltransferase PagP [Alphaproteobacteria bacterium]|jgi:palmitoyl transferase|nr:lipid IV(A) palmitoyltransferase PagP [Alphaproteobacteria bacterium]
MKTLKLIVITVVLLLSGVISLQANFFSNFFVYIKNNITKTIHSSQYDFYLPVKTWHSRFTYDQNLIDYYNEKPWGAGFGKSYWNDGSNWNGIYGMAFKDSHNNWQPIFGYGWEKTLRPLSNKNFHAGLGYTVGITSRENWDYMVSPVLLPLASVGYKALTLQLTYIPVIAHNLGNIWFAWIRIQF